MTLATHFSSQLLSLNKKLLCNDEEKLILVALIDYLLEKMQIGNSCIYLEDFCVEPKTPSFNLTVKLLVNLLNKSGLCGIFNVAADNLVPLPLTILLLNNNKHMFYLTRYIYYEICVVKKLISLANKNVCYQQKVDYELSQIRSMVKNNFPNEEQILAIQESSLNQLSFITGGPGTGKTTTITVLLVLLIRIYKNLNKPLKIHVVAPTGKAAIRAKESVNSHLERIQYQFSLTTDELFVFQNIFYGTIHKLLNYKYGSIYFKYNNENPLDTDILIVDESSMISLPLMYKLLLAIDKKIVKHVFFLGDGNQLSSVEEGCVFSSLAGSQAMDLSSQVITISNLKITNRNLGAIAKLASSIINKDINQVGQLINSSHSIKLLNNTLQVIINNIFLMGEEINDYFKNLPKLICNNQSEDTANKVGTLLINEFKKNVILCAVNSGILGVDNLNLIIERIIKDKLSIKDVWYTGRAILVLENNNNLDLYNGDIGICVIVSGKPKILFENKRYYLPEMLPHYQLAYAITIHKSQGSEYNNVHIILPETTPNTSVLLSRELLYTAVTRAKENVIIYSDIETINRIILNENTRNSGIGYLLSAF